MMPPQDPSLSGSPSQIALPLARPSRGEPQRIVIGNANTHVIEALGNPTAWPFRVAVLTGPARSGKTLLGNWIAREQAGVDIEVIDEAHDVDETHLFHRWNAVQEGGVRAGGSLLLIAGGDASQGGWQIALPDLASRIGGSLHLELTEPDDDMAAVLIGALAEQRGLSLPDGAADYLVPRTTRSFAAIEALVDQIDRISLERQTPATMSVWRAALEALQGPEQARMF
jgi:hypothetical protein